MLKRQTLVAQSSTEAEYVVVATAAKEMFWLRSFLAKVGADKPGPMRLWLDNMSTITITKNNKFHAHTKHIDICHHFMCEAVKQGMIDVAYMPTGKNVANSFTKPVLWPTFDMFVWELVLVPI